METPRIDNLFGSSDAEIQRRLQSLYQYGEMCQTKQKKLETRYKIVSVVVFLLGISIFVIYPLYGVAVILSSGLIKIYGAIIHTHYAFDLVSTNQSINGWQHVYLWKLIRERLETR